MSSFHCASAPCRRQLQWVEGTSRRSPTAKRCWSCGPGTSVALCGTVLAAEALTADFVSLAASAGALTGTLLQTIVCVQQASIQNITTARQATQDPALYCDALWLEASIERLKRVMQASGCLPSAGHEAWQAVTRVHATRPRGAGRGAPLAARAPARHRRPSRCSGGVQVNMTGRSRRKTLATISAVAEAHGSDASSASASSPLQRLRCPASLLSGGRGIDV